MSRETRQNICIMKHQNTYSAFNFCLFFAKKTHATENNIVKNKEHEGMQRKKCLQLFLESEVDISFSRLT